MKALIDLPIEGEIAKVPYAGFDIRDVKDYNMENMEEYNLTSSSVSHSTSLTMKGSTDILTTISIWLLLLFEIYRTPSRIIGDDFRNRRISLLGMNFGLGMNTTIAGTRNKTPLKQDSFNLTEGEDDFTTNPIEKFLGMIIELLNLSKKFKEDSYLLGIKVITAINWQVPTKDLVGSTEVILFFLISPLITIFMS